MGIGGLDLWEVVLIFVVVLALFLAGQIGKRQTATGNSPEDTLRDRFARGEISEEELREMLQALRDSQTL